MAAPTADLLAAREEELQAWEVELMEKEADVDACMLEIKNEAAKQLGAIQAQQHDLATRVKAMEVRESAVARRERAVQLLLDRFEEALSLFRRERESNSQLHTTSLEAATAPVSEEEAVAYLLDNDVFATEDLMLLMDGGKSPLMLYSENQN